MESKKPKKKYDPEAVRDASYARIAAEHKAQREKVKVGKVPETYHKVSEKPKDKRMPPSYYMINFVNSARKLKNAAVTGGPTPIITSSGRTY